MKTILYKGLLPILMLVGGILLGILIRDFPKFTLVYEIKITDAIGNVLTLGVGIFVPIIIKKIIDDTRSIKAIMINEVDNYYESLEPIFQIVTQCYNSKKLTRQNKENISLLLDLAETKLESLKKCLGEHFPKVLDSELQSFADDQNSLWKKLTGNSFSAAKIKLVDQPTYNAICQLHESIKSNVTRSKTKIHKS